MARIPHHQNETIQCSNCQQVVAKSLFAKHRTKCQSASNLHDVSSQQRVQYTQKSEGRDSLSIENGEDANVVIYTLIKEMDWIIENNSQVSNGIEAGREASINEQLSNGGFLSNFSDNQGPWLPAQMIADYKELLNFAVEIFQNNFNPQDILRHSCDVDKLLLRSFAVQNRRGGSAISTTFYQDQMIADSKATFIQHSKRLQQVANKKYETLATFLREQNSETLFMDTIDSQIIADMLHGDQMNNSGLWQSNGAIGHGKNAEHMALEDILENNLLDFDGYDYPNQSRMEEGEERSQMTQELKGRASVPIKKQLVKAQGLQTSFLRSNISSEDIPAPRSRQMRPQKAQYYGQQS